MTMITHTRLLLALGIALATCSNVAAQSTSHSEYVDAGLSFVQCQAGIAAPQGQNGWLMGVVVTVLAAAIKSTEVAGENLTVGGL
jgi:hypothetical protein